MFSEGEELYRGVSTVSACQHRYSDIPLIIKKVKSIRNPSLATEYELLAKLHKIGRGTTIKEFPFVYSNTTGRSSFRHVTDARYPRFYGFGVHEEWCYLVQERLGESLSAVEAKNEGCSFKPAFVARIGISILDRLEGLHSIGYIHQDIELSNILLGREGKGFYLVDFNKSRVFKSFSDDAHFKQKKTSCSIGSKAFMSVNDHDCLSLSRRDDLESLVYLLVQLSLGSLPWESEKNERKVKNMKLNFNPVLYNAPAVFGKILVYVRGLDFATKPDYSLLNGLLKDFILEEEFNNVDLRSSIIGRGCEISPGKSRNNEIKYNTTCGKKRTKTRTIKRKSYDIVALNAIKIDVVIEEEDIDKKIAGRFKDSSSDLTAVLVDSANLNGAESLSSFVIRTKHH